MTTLELSATLSQSREKLLSMIRAKRIASADAEDILQTALQKALSRIDTLKDEQAILPWLKQIVRNTLIDHLRLQKRERVTDGERLESLLNQAQNTSEEEQWLHPEEENEIHCFCAGLHAEALPDDFRQLVQEVDAKGRRVAEVAEEMAISPNLASVRLHRARKSLRESLTACCGKEAANLHHRCDC